jgi:colanic acid/amylovoran biosynthesis glycosyltransferase
LRAMGQVRQTHPYAQTVVIGDGPLRPSLEKLAGQLGIPCQFLGAQPGSVVRQWLSTARVFCVPSITAANGDSEGLGMVFAEAQGMGTPVVSFRHGGVPEIVVEGRTGLLAQEGDFNLLALNIQRLLEDHGFWNRCAEEGTAWVRSRFDLKLQTLQLEQVYEELCRPTQNVNDPEQLYAEPLQMVAGRI